jgi:surface carbohydrate biosynthesis protein (TIGR04326 family)
MRFLPIRHPNVRFGDVQRFFLVKHVLLLLRDVVRFFLLGQAIHGRLRRDIRAADLSQERMIVTYYPNIDLQEAEKGVFRNRYYAYLQEALEADRKPVTWIAMYMENRSLSFDRALEYASSFIKKGQKIFFLEEFMTLFSRIKALGMMMKSCFKFILLEKKIREAHVWHGYNFYAIFTDDWYASFCGATGYAGMLYYSAFQRVLGTFKPKKCLFGCEMHAWEKALISAANGADARPQMQAYQHAGVSRMLLNYFNHPSEFSVCGKYAMPVPDKLLCNGSHPMRHMYASGWPQEKVVGVEAIRFLHLQGHLNRRVVKHKKVLLVALSISFQESISILNIVIQTLKEMPDGIRVEVKPHPFLDLDRVLNCLAVVKRDFNFDIVAGPLEEYLSEAQIVIAGESSVSLEALALGCTVISLNTSEWINMSLLKDIDSSMVKGAVDPAHLRELVIDLFRRDHCPGTQVAEARRIIEDYFYIDTPGGVPSRFLNVF